ncbi:NAD(P) transhydrogenase subunit alpha part 1 [Luteitalea pratensis]|uniref:NAD(P) transhydrogenase subunit alpha part 1 n=1 Tax=Luteitalea pratensis TaxID=1855912 RepID=A0A143PVY2_LUTPR|nr:Re/Si-specific NAD(P)(+) transhydrogenase subunit alpha [Luteitalea pratensis]AMY12742.1 NAD(P) transhydrogenase subunit alpha part 1 [Luteitalea pratensis]
MVIGVPRELVPGEDRVALVPASVAPLIKSGAAVLVEQGAGVRAGCPDDAYAAAGATLVSRDQVFAQADILLQVRTAAAAGTYGAADVERLSSRHTVIGFADPLGAPETARAMAARGATVISMELIPRITRAQSMDALSSMANIAGYKAVLLAAATLPRMFPMMMTAAGTISPARVFVIGAGVAGLQAIATAKRLGAKIEAYDVRAAVKEQIESLGAKFVELPLDTAAAEGQGGYAAAQDESFYRRQRETMARVVAHSDVVITTAAIPGKKSPVLITADMVASMPPGSVIVDLAAERGGNCELTVADETIVAHGVTIHGPTNLPATVPFHASQLYAKNLTTLLAHLRTKQGDLVIDPADEITREVLVTHKGEVIAPRLREQLGLAPLPAPVAAAAV